MVLRIITWIVGNKTVAMVLAALAFLALLSGSYFLGSHNGTKAANDHCKVEEAKAVNAAIARNSAALEAASAQRRIDDAKVASTTKGLSDVVKTQPDAAPTRRGVLLTCQRLRNTGTDVSRFPECAGSDTAG